jgi:hypothetical protein
MLVAKLSDEFQTIGRTKLERPPKQKQRWQRPAHEVLKLNTDGAFSSNTGAGGWGYVIRNEEGMVISAGVGSCSFLLDALHAEAVACLKGVQAVGELGISKIQVETLCNAEDGHGVEWVCPCSSGRHCFGDQGPDPVAVYL